MTNPTDLMLFGLGAGRAFGEAVAARLGRELSPHEERDFEDGEHKARPLVSVRRRDVFVFATLRGGPARSVNDELCRALFFIGAVRDAGAAQVTAALPYLCYARKDRKTKPRDPVTSRYVAALFEAVGADRVIALDVHNLAAYQNAFRIRAEHLEATALLVEHFAPLVVGRPVVVVSPDAGGVKRAERFRAALERRHGDAVGAAFVEKHRSEGVVRGDAVVGELSGATAIIIDDLISGGETIARAARACRSRGATAVYGAATHGLFAGDADRVLAEAPLAQLVVTSSVPPPPLPRLGARLTVLDAAPLFADAITNLHA
jgi:ribose-phosphate pyrophosphokinase